jgi:YidC/Oxa1 family membrane protein insertase
LPEYQNPGQEPGTDRRMLIVFVVILLALTVSQPLLKKYFPQTAAPTAPAPSTTGAQSSPPQTASPPSAKPSSRPSASAAPVSRQATSESETVIESDLYRVTFTNRGAQVKSWILKKFDNDAQNGPLDLVNSAASQRYGYPLSLYTYDEGVRNKLTSALYLPSQREGSDPSGESGAAKITVTSAKGELAGQTLTAPASVTFEYADDDLVVRKTFSFDRTYVIQADTSVLYKGQPIAAFPAWPAGFGDQASPASYAAALIDYQYNSTIERLTPKCGFFSFISRCTEMSGGNTLKGPYDWAGPSDQYFAAAFIPEDPESSALITLRNALAVPRDPSRPDSKETVMMDVLGAAVGNVHGPTVERIYVGPKELSSLEAVRIPRLTGTNPDLRGLVDFGTFSIIARPLFLWLRWTYFHIVPNWGWAIVLQTFIISVALMPLRFYQMRSMFKMQRVAPQVKSIQEKYKKYSMRDPRKAAMQEEIAALYKKEGANPVSGCLPMLIQLPFLYGYYRMLAIALDLRHAHWLWIHDLSSPEMGLLRLLPIGLVISMLVTQKMTPQAGMDPAQQRMMTVTMPLFMGFIFWNLAAGLNLYYTESNLISIAQQAMMNRTKVGREMREMMEKRARKKDKS